MTNLKYIEENKLSNEIKNSKEQHIKNIIFYGLPFSFFLLIFSVVLGAASIFITLTLFFSLKLNNKF